MRRERDRGVVAFAVETATADGEDIGCKQRRFADRLLAAVDNATTYYGARNQVAADAWRLATGR